MPDEVHDPAVPPIRLNEDAEGMDTARGHGGVAPEAETETLDAPAPLAPPIEAMASAQTPSSTTPLAPAVANTPRAIEEVHVGTTARAPQPPPDNGTDMRGYLATAVIPLLLDKAMDLTGRPFPRIGAVLVGLTMGGALGLFLTWTPIASLVARLGPRRRGISTVACLALSGSVIYGLWPPPIDPIQPFTLKDQPVFAIMVPVTFEWGGPVPKPRFDPTEVPPEHEIYSRPYVRMLATAFWARRATIPLHLSMNDAEEARKGAPANIESARELLADVLQYQTLIHLSETQTDEMGAFTTYGTPSASFFIQRTHPPEQRRLPAAKVLEALAEGGNRFATIDASPLLNLPAGVSTLTAQNGLPAPVGTQMVIDKGGGTTPVPGRRRITLVSERRFELTIIIQSPLTIRSVPSDYWVVEPIPRQAFTSFQFYALATFRFDRTGVAKTLEAEYVAWAKSLLEGLREYYGSRKAAPPTTTPDGAVR